VAQPVFQLVFPNRIWLEDTGRKVNGWRPVKRLLREVPVILRLWDGREIEIARIEEGFESDGVSVPRLLAWWQDPWGPQYPEALLHDWFLELQGRGLIGEPKFLVDVLFLAALVSKGTSYLRSMLLFLGVRTKGFEPG
jgi:hypothetical protein